MFNGVELSVTTEKKTRMTQQKKILNVATQATQEPFRSQQALMQCIDANCRPGICATIQSIALGNSIVEENQYKSLKKTVDCLKESSNLSLSFIRLDMRSARAVLLLPDVSFANAFGMKS